MTYRKEPELLEKIFKYSDHPIISHPDDFWRDKIGKVIKSGNF